MEHRQVEDRPATPYRGSGDDPTRFLRELRQLRDGAGLGPAELAARAHYPFDRIKAAEVGPTLPDLPVLSAYVRGCGGTIEEWEERWRSLTSAPTLPLLDARPAGCSTAASAGARIGSISPVADTPDPSVILAALDRVAEEMAVSTPAPLPSRAGVSTIEQRPAIPVLPPAVAATSTASTVSTASTASTATKSAGGKAATGKVTAWETTTMRTAWSTAAGQGAREAGQGVGVGGTATAAGAGTTAAGTGTPAAAGTAPGGTGTGAGAGTAPDGAGAGGGTTAGGAGTTAARPVAAGYSAATLGKAQTGGGAVGGFGSAGAGGSGQSAATKPAVGAGAASTAAAGSIMVGWRARGLSRTTVVALIAIAVCVLVALLAVLA